MFETLLSVQPDPRAIPGTLDLAQPESRRRSAHMANTMLKTTSFVGQQLAAPRPTRPCASRASVRVAAAAQRPLFFPGAAPPEYLDDSLAGLHWRVTQIAQLCSSLQSQRHPFSPDFRSSTKRSEQTHRELLIRTVATTSDVLLMVLPPIALTPAPHCCSAGDYGWDPLGLGADPTALKWCVRITARPPRPLPIPAGGTVNTWRRSSGLCRLLTRSLDDGKWCPVARDVARLLMRPSLCAGTDSQSCSTPGGRCSASPASSARRS